MLEIKNILASNYLKTGLFLSISFVSFLEYKHKGLGKLYTAILSYLPNKHDKTIINPQILQPVPPNAEPPNAEQLVIEDLPISADISEYNKNISDGLELTKQLQSYLVHYRPLFNELSSHKLDIKTLNQLENKTIIEETPKGQILMYYDYTSESFQYYGSKKEVHYLILAAVAQKYCLTYDCKDIYIDEYCQLEEAQHRQIKLKETKDNKEPKENKETNENKEPNENKDPSQSTVYAKFKNYNIKTAEAQEANDKYVMCKKANRFTYKGSMDEYKSPMDKKQSLNIDFATFKKMHAETMDIENT